MPRHRFTFVAAIAGATLSIAAINMPAAQADSLGYLVNITVRPGYQFSGPEDALRYGYQLCADVSGGHSYAAMIGQIKTDQQTTDEYQAEYLLSQAIDELCPAQIWQLRQSAAGYQPPPG
ncbi:DUF732 domain-containing protein [Mycolicibacterium sp. lyk4-40-TYG-92]|uniref:DUF732 domain-containing protein n=1 Tax=Mycolicibacterium sp. lyk4-40-TYG-92 TaxID=3040295 RepID=UPI00254FE164|nr:DUF732 domain-containing protein [Mycolicibacterium sp. lyk4-40-TYG-92]